MPIAGRLPRPAMRSPANPLVERRERLGRVEVPRERVEEALAHGVELRRGLARRKAPRGLADAADVGTRLLERRSEKASGWR